VLNQVSSASWFQFYIKQLGVTWNPFTTKTNLQEDYPYEWYEMSFYVYAMSSGAAVAFCFDTPPVFQTNLFEAMNTLQNYSPAEAFQLLQSKIVGELSKLYDISIWVLRDHIRTLEKVESSSIISMFHVR
jgi:hypothetical protein